MNTKDFANELVSIQVPSYLLPSFRLSSIPHKADPANAGKFLVKRKDLKDYNNLMARVADKITRAGGWPS